jgi:hypothetical protein
MWPKSYDSTRWWTYRIWAVVPRRLSAVPPRRSVFAPVRTASFALLFAPLLPSSCPHRSVRIPVRTAPSATYPTQMRTATAPPRDSHMPPQPTARLARVAPLRSLRCSSLAQCPQPALTVVRTGRERAPQHPYRFRTASEPPAAVSWLSRRSVGSDRLRRALCRVGRTDREAWRSLTFGRVKWSSAKRRPVNGQ